jgi:putative endonuclease
VIKYPRASGGLMNFKKSSKMKQYYVYILTNKHNRMFYVGFTDDIQRRIGEHKNKKYDGFTKKYNVDKLVYFKTHLTDEDAKSREKRIKRWRREWKIKLIEKVNPEWDDLSKDLRKSLSPIEKMDLLFARQEK